MCLASADAAKITQPTEIGRCEITCEAEKLQREHLFVWSPYRHRSSGDWGIAAGRTSMSCSIC